MQRLDVFANQIKLEAHPHCYGEAWKSVERHSQEARYSEPRAACRTLIMVMVEQQWLVECDA
jgi:hypothetical protein